MDRNDLLEWQGRRCWTCGDAFDPARECCDHDHDTGVVRGWLCGPCNVAEGFDRPPDHLHGPDREAWDWDAYRRNPPARQFGLREMYDSDREPPSWEDYDRRRAGHLLRRSWLQDRDSIAVATGIPRAEIDEIAELVRPLVERDLEDDLEIGATAARGLFRPPPSDGEGTEDDGEAA